MGEHTERFTGRAEGYARFRQRYPAEAVEVLRALCGLGPGMRVADVGAGTGMVAELLADAGCAVTAVEPNAEMRAVCEGLLGGRVRVTDATAEATGLDAGAFDMVTAGRAFHWFDRERAAAEFRRILLPGGWVVLLSSRRAEDGSEQARAYESILREHGEGYAGLHAEKRQDEALRLYGRAARFRVVLAGEQRLTLEELAGQTQSYSVAPLPGTPQFTGMQAALQGYFERWGDGTTVRMETQCELAGWQTPPVAG